MDLEVLPPEDPTPAAPGAATPQWAPPPSQPAPPWQPAPAPWQPAPPPWQPGAPAWQPAGPPATGAAPGESGPGAPASGPGVGGPAWGGPAWAPGDGGPAWGGPGMPGDGGAGWGPGGPGDGGAGWGAGGPGGGSDEPPAERPRLARSTKLIGTGVAVALVAAGAWAAGTALHSSPSTVRFRAAAATTPGTSGGTSNGTPAHRGRGLFGMGAGGTVATVGASSFTVTAKSRPAPPANGASPSTGQAPAAPTTTTKTVDVGGSTTYYVTEQGSGADIAAGMRVTAFGQVGANNTITASAVDLVQAGIGPTPGTKSGTAPVNPPAPPANAPAPPAGTTTRPFTFGTVKSVSQSGTTYTVVVTSRAGDRTVIVNSSTTVTKTVKGSLGDVHVGDNVVVRGTRNSDGTVAASVVQVVSASLKGKGPFGPRFGPAFGPGFGFGPRGAFGRGHQPPKASPATPAPAV